MRSDVASERGSYFDALYAGSMDPWRFEDSEYESAKRADTLGFLRAHYSRACEVGCSIGVLSEQIAPRCDTFLGVDIAEAAASRARGRLVRLPNADVRVMHVPYDDLDADVDLLVLSEVLYFLSRDEISAMADLARRRVVPGGDVLIVSYDGETQTGLSGREATDMLLAACAPDFDLLRGEQREGYHVRLLRRRRNYPPSFDTALERIRVAAGQKDQSGAGLDEEIRWLGDAGLLREALPQRLSGMASWSDDPLSCFAVLRRIGAASLPVGRLFEGHVNAAQLIGLYGEPSLQKRCAEAVRDGALLGVWGADGTAPLTASMSPEGYALSGTKAFCSGLGLVKAALVSALMGDNTHLFYVVVDDRARMDGGQWEVSGMRATRSGGYDFNGVILPHDAAVGGPDAYYIEPHFLGGMMRMGAVQLGGLDALLEETVAALRLRGKGEDALASLRIGQIASLRGLALASVERLARRLVDQAPAQEIAHEAVLMREGLEHCIIQALEIAERGLGTLAHRETTSVSRLRRDLSFYIRQAAVDERLMAIGRQHLAVEQAHSLPQGGR
ncbi:SAM-dependent methyltransferase [Novosphingobium terrae]|uniref:SAM-dependent methyltransferase n=1 Tax=Novosphingobium terrae TaxID=2726189 RepID=UPI001981B054|nr:SAM-dependent methyltransferase [Novosphingobium terrae]